MKRLFVLMLVLPGISGAVAAQTEGTLYFMKSLPQVSTANPAFLPTYNYSIGLPGISSAGGTYSNNGFSYEDLVQHTNGTTTADLNGWKGSLTSRNYITAASQIDLMRVGFRTGRKLYFQISSTARQYTRTLLPQELTSLLVQQNAALTGTTAQFSPKIEGTAWLESAVSAAYSVNSKLTAGLRLKYLKGFVNASTVSSDMSIAVGADYSITASADARIRTSGIDDALAGGYSFSREFKNYMSNNGVAADFGASWKLSSKLTLAASLIDIGWIRWKNNLVDYAMDKSTANYHFEGINPDKLVQGDKSYLDDQASEIRGRFVFQKQQTKAYTTWIPGRMYMSASYDLIKNLSTGILLASEKYQGRATLGVTASVSKNFGRVVSTTVSYTVSNRSANNFGAGISLNLQPFQFYIAGDNLLNYPVSLLSSSDRNYYVNNTQVFTCRAGLNFVWGRQRDGNVSSGIKRMRKKAKAESGALKVRRSNRQ